MNRKYISFSPVIAALIISVDMSAASPETRTTADIISEIERNNPSILITRATNESEILEMQSANAPGATSIEYSPFFSRDYNGLASSELIVKQSFDFPTKYGARSNEIAARRTYLDASAETRVREVRIEARQACINLVATRLRNEIMQRKLASTDSISSFYSRKLKAGNSTKLELNRILLSRQEIEREILDLAATEAEWESALLLLNGGKSLDLTGLRYATEELPSIPSADTVALLVKSMPQTREALMQVMAAEKQRDTARQGWLPEVSVGYRCNTEREEATHGFVIGLDFPLFSYSREKKVAETRKAIAELEREITEKQTEAEIAATLKRLEAMKRTIESTDTALIDETLSLYKRSLELGQITLTDYYQESDMLYNRLLTRIDLEQAYRNLYATIEP